jgi:hypothetical protein
MSKTREEAQDKGLAFDNNLDFNVDNVKIEKGDYMLMVIVHLVDPQYFACVSSMVSRHLAEEFAKNSKPKGFHETVPTTLHLYKDVFSEMAFDILPKH